MLVVLLYMNHVSVRLVMSRGQKAAPCSSRGNDFDLLVSHQPKDILVPSYQGAHTRTHIVTTIERKGHVVIVKHGHHNKAINAPCSSHSLKSEGIM